MHISQSRKNVYTIECRDKNGNLKWTDKINNLVVDAGINDELDRYFKGSNYNAAFYVGLTGGSPNFQATDTMASHSGWSEVTAYNETERPAIVWGSVSNKSINNNDNPASFSINTDNTTIGGAFITTSNTKSGTTGVLYGGGAFNEGNKTLGNGDTVTVRIACSGSSS